MKYIIHKRFKSKALCGDVNLPAMTACDESSGVIYCDGKPICYATSENAHQYFASDEDGNGMLRGQLTQSIQKLLKNNQTRWDKLWEDNIALKYKRSDYEDYWLWSHDFFNAPIVDLQYIQNLIKGV